MDYIKRIYDADESKRAHIELTNNLSAFDRPIQQNGILDISEIVMIAPLPVNSSVLEGNINTIWNLNGLNISRTKNNNEIIIVEPLSEQINNSVKNISPSNTSFNKPIVLSEKSIMLIPLSLYEKMSEDEKVKIDTLDKTNHNIRFYSGEEDLAIKMLFQDLGYVYLDIQDNQYIVKNSDVKSYVALLEAKQDELLKSIKSNRPISGYKNSLKKHYTRIPNTDTYSRMISGLTEENEGSIKLDDNLFASTDIGKIRKNQEDAVLLIKDKDIPEFKMVVVADGIGGMQDGEIASNSAIVELKNWFEHLSLEEKKSYYTRISGLREKLLIEIETILQTKIESDTRRNGGTTLVCAITGDNETMVANIGDSRAYKVKNNKLHQISREDTIVQKKLEKGLIPSKEIARFHPKSYIISQCLGMSRSELNHPHIEIIQNNDYDMILLFSDGVTDCLSDEDIAVVCKTTNKKMLTMKIVEKAIRHDSILSEKYNENGDYTPYIPAGKDNATAAAIIGADDNLR